MKFLLEIITPERKAFSENVDMITVPTPLGTTGVLAHHMQLFTSLTEGEVKIVTGDKEVFLAIGGGFMQVTGDKVIVLVSRAIHAHELNEEEIRKAEKEAHQILAKAAKGEERASALSVLRRSVLEMKVLRRRRRSPQIN